jgi:Rps23 Pro-64 3,4-dihydroxylase Tpa1-like proline 4-hydroxylase
VLQATFWHVTATTLSKRTMRAGSLSSSTSSMATGMQKTVASSASSAGRHSFKVSYLLQLSSSDSDGNPAKITTRISPQWNSVAFFEATPTSFHEVGEVFKADEGRLSISGWFHGRLDTRMALRNFVDKPAPAELSQSSFTIVAEQYTKAEQVQRLREEFAQSSTLTVTDFLSPKALASVQREDLNSADKFQKDPIGPASVRRFHVPPAGSSLARILEDPSMFAWLEKITSTTIRKQRTTVRLFKQGCYQIIHDQALDPVGLDVVLSLGNGTKEPWDKKHGGRLAYTAAADDDSSTSMASDAGATLFEAWPEFNTLTIVLRDEGVLKSVGWVKQGVAGLGGRVDAEAVYLLEPQEVESDQEGDVPTDGDNLEEEFTGINSD